MDIVLKAVYDVRVTLEKWVTVSDTDHQMWRRGACSGSAQLSSLPTQQSSPHRYEHNMVLSSLSSLLRYYARDWEVSPVFTSLDWMECRECSVWCDVGVGVAVTAPTIWVTLLGRLSPSPVVTRVTPQGETRLSHQSSSCVMWCGEAWPVIWSYNEWRTLQLNRVKRSRCV